MEKKSVGNRNRVCQWFGFTEWGFRERLDERLTWEPSSGGERRRPATGEMGGRVFQAEGTAAGKSPRPEARVAGVEGMRGEDRLGAEGNGSGGHLEGLHFGSEWHGMCWEVFEQGRRVENRVKWIWGEGNGKGKWVKWVKYMVAEGLWVVNIQ